MSDSAQHHWNSVKLQDNIEKHWINPKPGASISFHLDQYSSVQFSHLVMSNFFSTPWTAARQASLSITNSRSTPKLMFIESVMPSNHLILCCSLLLLPSIFLSIRSFQMSQLFASSGQSIGVSASTSVLSMNIQNWFSLGLIRLNFLLPKGLSRVFSSTAVWSVSSSVLTLLYDPTLT